MVFKQFRAYGDTKNYFRRHYPQANSIPQLQVGCVQERDMATVWGTD
jgi:hypothetical protein